jgi:hypothetical protein
MYPVTGVMTLLNAAGTGLMFKNPAEKGLRMKSQRQDRIRRHKK